MELNNKQTLLKTGKNTYKTVDGVTYFKLRSEFEGDYTKNCGLLGEEIDANFYFLRGYDIKNMYLDANKNLVIERVDEEYSPLTVNIGEDYTKYSFKFEKEDGTIIITMPDGTINKMDGFLVEGQDIRMSTDGSLEGDGTIYNPLKISGGHKTGTYSPAEIYIDLTKSNSKMPEGKGKGYRIVTKEKIDNFGRLYPYNSVLKIEEALKATKSQWRVPTKNDWDELLNSLEVDPSYRNHNQKNATWLGSIAGSALKSVKFWENYPVSSTDIPVKGEDVVDFTAYPLGISPERNEILDDSNSDIEGFRRLSGFWTNTTDEIGNAYVKILGYNSAKVKQDTYGGSARMSIRLVKDYNFNNYNEIEYILGLPYPTELVNSVCEDIKYSKIWTKINVYMADPGLNGLRSEEWMNLEDADMGIKDIYYINEWDGETWHKKIMEDGDSVVIKNHNNKPYHEWRVIGEELVDTIDSVMEEFEETLTEINDKISNETSERQENDEKLLHLIQDEIQNRKDSDNELHTLLSNEKNERIESINKVRDAISNETTARVNADKQLQNNINSEIENRKNEDTKLFNEIQKEILKREETDKQLQNKIESEIEKRQSEDEKLLNRIQIEEENRKQNDIIIKDTITSEIEKRNQIVEEIKELINNEKNIRYENDITPNDYIITNDGNKTIMPTNGTEVSDITLQISSDFFNFGKIIE